MSDGTQNGRKVGVNRRKVLECMTWAGTGVLWTISGGVPRSLGIIDTALAAEPNKITFLQISDSHVGFDKPANPNVIGTLEEAIAKVKSLPGKPSFMIHTGDITHLSKPAEFDNAQGVISKVGLDVHYVPGEHDLLDEDTKLKWLADDVKGKSAETPIVVFAHIPLWTVYEKWGWGTDDGARALELLKRFGSVTVLNGHIHQVMQKVEGNVAFHTAMATAFPQPAPGTAPSPGPMKVADDKLRSLLGITEVNFVRGQKRLALIDKPLQG
jgi:3',5'-cyclic AMP phosphodiesterase CpdA